MAVQIQMRRGTTEQWSTTNPTLAEGEIGLELDTQKFKMGTGTTPWNSLVYYTAGASPVDSVNGQIGLVVLDTDDISEGTTNKYYTDARARGSLSAGTGISYNSTTGAISSTITQYSDASARAAVSASGSLSYNSTTGVFSYTQPTNVSTFTNDSGYLTSSAIGSTVQGYDADLQAIGALTGTSGLLKKTAANTWSLDTSTYLTSYTETDPVYTASSWYSTTNNSSNWDTAYGWGNHASAGYLTSATAATTYAPLTGTGASGTWGISITGNAATATNVAYTGLTGTVPTWNQNTTGTASNVTGTVAIANGGTGQTTANAGLNALLPSQTSNGGKFLTTDGTNTSWATVATGSGTVTSVSVVSANGFAGTVATASTTPAITLSTSISGMLYGNGTALAAATISSPLAYSAGTLSIPAANGTTNGYLSSTDWTTFNNKGSGTVTSVAALTLGTTGTDLSSTVANGTTTPVITLNVPTASATNRGALSSTDWSTFNGKQAALVSGTNIKTVGGASLLGSGDVGTIGLAYGGTGKTTAPAAMANLMGYTTTATSGTPVALSNTSSFQQLFTGTTNQTVTLPDTSTLALGWSFYITNDSTGTMTVNSFGGNLVGTIPPGLTAMPTAISTTVNTAAAWDWAYNEFSTITGTGNLVLATSPTLTTPVFSSIVNTGTLTLPTSTDTLVARATTDALSNKTLTLTAGSNTVAPIVLTSGTNLSTPAAGAVEYDGTIMSATSNTNFKRGVIPLMNYTSGAGTNLSGNGETTLQALLPSANDTITLSSGTYFVDIAFTVTRTGTSTTSATARLNLLGGGNAAGTFSGMSISAPTAGGASNNFSFSAVNINVSNVLTAASATAGGVYTMTLRGVMKITTSGTIVPQYNLSATLGTGQSGGASCSVLYFNLTQMDSQNNTATGPAGTGWA